MTKRDHRASTVAGIVVALVATSTFGGGVARADDAAAPSQGATAQSAAQDHYTAGRESYRLGLYGRALEEFERSLALAPSPNTRLYIARSLRELGRWAEANEQYTATVREAEQRGGRYTATRDAATVELADVKVRLERATASTNTSDRAPNAGPDANANGNASDGAVADSGAPHRGPSTLTWVAGGVAVAGAASFAILYAMSGNRFAYLEDNCARVRTSNCDDARTTGKTEEVAGYAALGVAVVAGVITVYSLLRAPSIDATTATTATLTPRGTTWPLTF